MSPKKILLVEDDMDIREILEDLLRDEGYEVSSAVNGRNALDTLKRPGFRPDLILLDLMMPVMDGFQFREAQSQDLDLRDIPVVVMSADSRLFDQLQDARILERLRKPLDVDTLLRVIAGGVA